MNDLVAILDGSKATAWVYDFGTHLQVQFQRPGTLGVENRIVEFPLLRPFKESDLRQYMRRVATMLRGERLSLW